MSQQQTILQLPRHTATVQQLANANKIGKTTVVFACFLDWVNTGIEKLNEGFLHFIDKQVELGPGNLPKVRFTIIPSFLKLFTVSKNAISSELLYIKKDWQTFKRY